MLKISNYVLQFHKALVAGNHFDFRIQYPDNKSKLMSWALPKGKVPKKIGEKYLAVRTPDHRKEWLSFSGKIAADEYGGGTVSISQSGVLKIEKWEEDKIVFVIVGDKMNGRFSLIKLKKSKTDQEEWLLIKVKDKLKEYFINQFMNRII